MRIKKKLIEFLRNVFLKSGFVITRLETINKLNDPSVFHAFGFTRKQILDPKTLPPGAKEILCANNPELIKLKKKYREIDWFEHSFWGREFLNSDLEMQFFRADNHFLWQIRSNSTHQYFLSYYDVKHQDDLGLLKQLDEDGLFGAYCFTENGGRLISRDLMDSVLEINFLERNIKISQLDNLNVLDIGAGYGRLANRMVSGLGNIAEYFCVDAIPESTYICDYYLKFRNRSPKAVSVPLYEIDRKIPDDSIHLAVNIDSFPGCTIETIKWWLDFIARKNIRWLMIAPLKNRFLSLEENGERVDYLSEIVSRGYSLIAESPKYQNPDTQENGLYPGFYFLFERTN